MSQPALLIAPDLFSAQYFLGTIGAHGSCGGSPLVTFLNGSNTYRSAGMNTLPALLPEVGAQWTFNGILLLPTASEYRMPNSKTVQSGVYLPEEKVRGADWHISFASGVGRFINDQGFFTQTPGLAVQVFDKKVILTCTRRDELPEEPDVEAILTDLRSTVALSSEIMLYGVNGGTAFIVSVTLEKREDPPPQKVEEAPPPPRRRARKPTEGK